MRHVMRWAVVVVLAATSAGCSMVFDVNENLQFVEREDKIPLRLALYVPPEVQSYEWEARADATTRLHGAFGEALASNACRAFAARFAEVNRVSNRTSTDADAVIVIRPGQMTFTTWKEGISYCRTYGQELVADVYAPTGEHLLTAKSDVHANSRRYKMTIEGEVEGEGDGKIMAKIIFMGPTYTTATSIPALFSRAIDGITERNLARITEQVAEALGHRVPD